MTKLQELLYKTKILIFSNNGQSRVTSSSNDDKVYHWFLAQNYVLTIFPKNYFKGVWPLIGIIGNGTVSQDLSDEEVWLPILNKCKAGKCDGAIIMPTRVTFSMAPFASPALDLSTLKNVKDFKWVPPIFILKILLGR